jgi:hypothetical protein
VRATGNLLTPAQVENLLVDTAHQFGSRQYAQDARNPASTTGTSFDAGHGLVDVTAAVSKLTGLAAPPDAASACAPDARFDDVQGDATGALGTTTPLPNASGLDIVESWLTTDTASNDVTVHIAVDDLAETPGGLEGTGEYFDYNFTLGGAGYYLGATRTAEDGTSFVLGNFGGAQGSRQTLASGLPGAFDAAADEISVTLPAAKWAELNLPGQVAPGQQIAGLNIVARRSLVLLVPDADAAAGGCAYTIGASAAGGTGSLATPQTNRAPSLAKVGMRAPGKVLRAGQNVWFRAIAHDPDGDRLHYRWTFPVRSANESAKGSEVRNRFGAAGTYRVRLVVSDGTHTVTKRFKVHVHPRRG